MKNKLDRLISFVVAFAITILSFLYFVYLQEKKNEAIVHVYNAIKQSSKLGLEIGYKNLRIKKNPGYIDFMANDIDFLTAINNIYTKNAEVRFNNKNNITINFADIGFSHGYSAKVANFFILNKNIEFVVKGVDLKGIYFDEIVINARISGNYLEISQLVIRSKNLSVIAQGGCEFVDASDYRCKLNTSSKGVFEFFEKAEEKDIFTSRGVYVANLVLKTQTSQRTIAPIEFSPKGFYIKNILMTSEKNSNI